MTLLQYAGFGLGAIAVLAADTMFLPRNVVVQRTGSVAVSPAAIMAMATSNQGYQKFNPYLKADPALKIEMFGPASGVGSGFKFDGKDGTGMQSISAVSANRVDYAIDLGAMGKPNQSIAVAADGTGSSVTWTMQADMGNNPIGRIIGLFMDGMVGPTFENGIKHMGEAL
jgi:hypothetical protein